jgi:hypothetical protein
MKTTLLATLFVLCLLTSAAFGQTGASSISNQPVVTQVPSHPSHASQRFLQQEQNLLFASPNISARGERPLWEFSKPATEVPLGDIARAFREQHAIVKKAAKVVEQ